MLHIGRYRWILFVVGSSNLSDMAAGQKWTGQNNHFDQTSLTVEEVSQSGGRYSVNLTHCLLNQQA